MRTVSTLVAALFTTAAAAPAIVWTGETGSSTRQSSEVIEARALLSSAASESSLSNVVFVVGRDEHGSEGLTGLTASGSLPKVSSMYADANVVHHYVRGVESVDALQKDAEAANPSANVIKTSLSDFKVHHINNKEHSSASVGTDGSIASSADTIVVSVPVDAAPADIDSAVSSAIENSKVGSVVLTSVRGITEVKLERDIKSKQNFYEMQQKRNRRRLEDADQGDEDATEAIYFVNYTPNIFAGLLFFFFFVAITYVGLGCMDMIAGQDVYVSKYPTIGREV